jgi:hypothetical protein
LYPGSGTSRHSVRTWPTPRNRGRDPSTARAGRDPARRRGDPLQPDRDPLQPDREHRAFDRNADVSRREVPRAVAPGPSAGRDLDEKHACRDRSWTWPRGQFQGMSGPCPGLNRGPVSAKSGRVQPGGQPRFRWWNGIQSIHCHPPRHHPCYLSRLQGRSNRGRGRSLFGGADGPQHRHRARRDRLQRSKHAARRCAARHRRSRARCRRGAGSPAPPDPSGAAADELHPTGGPGSSPRLVRGPSGYKPL